MSGGSAIPLGHSWFPGTASNLVIEFESQLTTGLFSVDVVQVRALMGPGTVDSDGDGTPDELDGCPTDPNKTVPAVCGCGSPDVDPDGDGIVNCDSGACGGCAGAADIDCDGIVGITDLLSLLGQWGPCDPAPASCPADVDRDGTVGLTDFLAVLAEWSP